MSSERLVLFAVPCVKKLATERSGSEICLIFLFIFMCIIWWITDVYLLLSFRFLPSETWIHDIADILVWVVDKNLHVIKKRRVWKYQRDNQNPSIEEEQTTQSPKEKVQKDKQRSTKHTHKTKDRVTRTPLETVGELRCSGRVSISCSKLRCNVMKWVREWLSFNAKWVIYQPYHGAKKLHCDEIMSVLC